MSENIAILLIIIIGLSLSLIASRIRLGKKPEETTGDRITKLTSSLQEAAHLIRDIGREVEDRSKLAEKLHNDVQTYEILRQVRKEEVEALVQVLQTQAKQSSRQGMITNFGISFIFFCLGSLVAWLVTWLVD